MPRAKKDQLTNEQRDHVRALEELYSNAGIPAREARRRARVAVQDAPSGRPRATQRVGATGKTIAQAGGKIITQRRATRGKHATGK